MTKPLVSVIIPAYNSAKFIGTTLDSVKKITYPNWECVIMNDGSTDNTLQVAEEVVSHDPRFTLLTQPNSGPSIARNSAIANSRGKYILPLDADDLISPNYIEEGVNVLENEGNVKIVYCEAVKFGRVSEPWNLPEYSFKALLKENMIFCTALYRKEDFHKTRGYDPELRAGREDWDFWIEMLKTGGEVYKLPGVHFYYRTHQESRDKKANRNLPLIRKRIYENHKELYHQLFIDNPIQLYHEHAKYKKKYNLLRCLTFRKPIP